MEYKKTIGYLAVLLTILIWGIIFISTKVLLVDVQSVGILFFRFVMGFLVLLIVYPYRIKETTAKQELTFAATGFCGICVYYLLENMEKEIWKKLYQTRVI